jgi:hypothetical protein
MSALIAWLAAAPQGAIAALTAALAAIVALLVAVLTQWILGRRLRTEHLTKKLEDLYLALNEVSAHSVKKVEEALPLASATPFNKPKITGGSVERQGLDLHKKIVMLVRPVLSKALRGSPNSVSLQHQGEHAHLRGGNRASARRGAPARTERRIPRRRSRHGGRTHSEQKVPGQGPRAPYSVPACGRPTHHSPGYT